SIPINTAGFSIGQTIYVVGYPVIADDSELISSTQVLSSSVTKGSISSIKPNTNNTFDLVQIDAAIQGGNSGGPIIDEDGNVVAVATYSISSDSGNYNYGVSSKELQTFLSNSSIQPQINPMRIELEKSLSDVSLSYYKRAQKSLEDILLKQPNLTVTLQPVLDLCQERIEAGEDKTPLLDINNRILMIVILVILLLLLVISVVFLMLNIKKISQKKKQLSQTPNLINQ
ncbi:MAG TPA: serine protease, partial [Candidatus Dojkabacteria bacterium]|nr:serine protease [Candidatus Dojkabacteria bacterium]